MNTEIAGDARDRAAALEHQPHASLAQLVRVL
jgi:hypothetical protein